MGLVGTLLVAGCSLAIAVVSGVVERRRALALLRLSGMPMSRLQTMAILEAAVPLVVVTVLAARRSVWSSAQILLRVATAGGSPPLPGPRVAGRARDRDRCGHSAWGGRSPCRCCAA